MLLRILLGAVSVAAGLVSPAVAADGAGSDVSPTVAASAPTAELAVAPPTDYPDVRLARGYRDGGKVAVNPADPTRLVVGIGFPGDDKCFVKSSADGGKTWGPLVPLPRAAGSGSSYCATIGPAITYSANGSRLYAAYTYVEPLSSYSTFVVLVSVSADNGITWSAPKTALTTGDASEEDGFVDIQLAAQADGPRLYMALNYRGYHGRFLHFASSSAPGSWWSPSKLIAVAFPDEGTDLLGVALAAGRGGTVLLAYGWSEVLSNYNFSMQVARSRDHGDSFLYGIADRRSAASDDGSLWLSQPDIKIGQLGTAHLVYARGSTAVFYKYSLPPYQTWSATAVRLDDDVPAAELLTPRLAVGACGPASVLHATWGQNRAGTGSVLYTRKVAQTGYGWSAPLMIGASSGRVGYNNEIAGTGARAFSVSPRNRVIFGSRVWSGVTCP